MVEKEDITISISDEYATIGMLTYPLPEEIAQLGRIRLGESLVRKTDECMDRLWYESRVGYPDVPEDIYREIVETMDTDFKVYLTHVKDMRARNILEENVRRRLNTLYSTREMGDISEAEYQSLMKETLVEEREKLDGVLKEREAFAMTGDSRFIGHVMELWDYLNAAAFFNLYLTAYCHKMDEKIIELYDRETSPRKDKIQRKVNLVVNPLFVEIGKNALNFNPQGIMGASSYRHLAQSVADTIFDYNIPVFVHPESEDALLLPEAATFHDGGKFYTEDYVVSLEGYRRREAEFQRISLYDLMRQNFDGEEVSHYPQYCANVPGAVLLVKKVGERYKDIIVIDKDESNGRMLSGNLFALEVSK